MIRQVVLHGSGDVRLDRLASSLRAPRDGEVGVQARLGLISAGTERRMYLGLPVPEAVDAGFRRAYFINRRTRAFANRTPTGGTVAQMDPMRTPTYPSGLGYNSVAVVERVGGGRTTLAVGQRVMTVAPFVERTNLPAWQVAVIPEAVADEDAVLAYLATLGLNALRRIGFEPGAVVVVQGLGLVGLAAALVAAASGGRVIGLEPQKHRRAVAMKTGAFLAVLDPFSRHADRDLLAAVLPDRIDHVIETAGTSSALANAIRLVKRRGSIALLALYDARDSNPLAGRLHERECMLVSCANDAMVDPSATDERYTIVDNLRLILEWMARGRMTLAPLITHRFPIEEVGAAYALLDRGAEPSLGITLRWESRPQRGRVRCTSW